MLTRFVCVFACFVLAHCLPTRLPTEESVINITDKELQRELNDLARGQAELYPEEVFASTNNVMEDEESNVAAKEETDVANEDGVTQNSRERRNVKERSDIETIVTVKNNEIGTEKQYYFKTINREVKGEKYRCKIGITSGEVMFYYRCLLISNGVGNELLQETGQSDFFDFA